MNTTQDEVAVPNVQEESALPTQRAYTSIDLERELYGHERADQLLAEQSARFRYSNHQRSNRNNFNTQGTTTGRMPSRNIGESNTPKPAEYSQPTGLKQVDKLLTGGLPVGELTVYGGTYCREGMSRLNLDKLATKFRVTA